MNKYNSTPVNNSPPRSVVLDVPDQIKKYVAENPIVNVSSEVAAYMAAHPVTATADSTKVDKVSGKGLSTNDLTNTLKTNYDKAYTHSQAEHAPSDAVNLTSVKADRDISDSLTKRHAHSNSIILDAIQEALTTVLKSGYDVAVTASHAHSNKSVIDLIEEALTTALKTAYDGAVTHAASSHAPSNAQKNSDIQKSEIEAVLTGAITSHYHSVSNIISADMNIPADSSIIIRGRMKVNSGVRIKPMLNASIMVI